MHESVPPSLQHDCKKPLVQAGLRHIRRWVLAPWCDDMIISIINITDNNNQNHRSGLACVSLFRAGVRQSGAVRFTVKFTAPARSLHADRQ